MRFALRQVVSIARIDYMQLFLELDKLIVRNNQTPKPSCLF